MVDEYKGARFNELFFFISRCRTIQSLLLMAMRISIVDLCHLQNERPFPLAMIEQLMTDVPV